MFLAVQTARTHQQEFWEEQYRKFSPCVLCFGIFKGGMHVFVLKTFL